MRRLVVFNQVSLDGYFTDRNGDMSWAHKDDAEWNAFAADNAKGGGVLLFGRITYEMMASFWPTPVKEKLTLKQTKARTFGNGNVLLCYEPTA